MGYYCSITQDSVLQGPLIFSEESRSANSVPTLHNGVLQTEAIFQIILLNYDMLNEVTAIFRSGILPHLPHSSLRWAI